MKRKGADPTIYIVLSRNEPDSMCSEGKSCLPSRLSSWFFTEEEARAHAFELQQDFMSTVIKNHECGRFSTPCAYGKSEGDSDQSSQSEPDTDAQCDGPQLRNDVAIKATIEIGEGWDFVDTWGTEDDRTNPWIILLKSVSKKQSGSEK